ncbi:MAG: lipopolysaccharide biosynthesis protein [Pseudothermotoga sp.]|nr:lipopolysaccharide biosynthesis protein [Pseudothermotoga sp.]MDI6863628.1 lipopolysaccharide biosynthesis protein [Pseudothermotoga sp.]
MKQYLKSYVSFSLGMWFRAGISFLSVPVISYLIIPEEFGKSAMFTMTFSVITGFMFLGTDQSFMRFFNEYREEERRRLFWACLSPSFVVTTCVSFMLFVFGKQISLLLYGKVYPNINLLMAITLYLVVLQRFNQSLVRMRKKGFLYSLIDSVNAVGNFVFTLLYALFVERSFMAIVFGNMMGYVLALLTGIYFGKEYWKPARFSFSEVRAVLKFGLPFVPNLLLAWLFTSMDRISLRRYSTMTEIGLYSAAFKIASVMNLFQTGFSLLWMPTAYERYEKDKGDTVFFKKTFEMVSFVLFAVGFLVVGFKDVIFLLLAKSYRASAQIAPFLILVPIMQLLWLTSGVGINLTKKTYWHMVISSIATLLNFVGNTLLVPLYGALGAAISTGLSYVLYFYMRTSISEKLFPVRYDIKRASAGILMMIIVSSVGTLNRNLWLNMMAGIIGLCAVVCLYRKEFALLKKEMVSFVRTRTRNSKPTT